MALKDLKKMMSDSVNALFGDDLDDVKAELLNAKKKIQDTAEATGIDKGLKNAWDFGTSKLNEGKEKLQEIIAADNNGFENDKDGDPEHSKEGSHFSELDSQLEQIKSLNELVEMGILTEDEFQKKKREILGLE